MIQAFLAALALPVVGFVTGRVVGDYYSVGGRVGEIGMGVGITVYMIALMASYAHLRHYYTRFEHHPARAAPFIALAVEVVTFYMSFSYVVLHSQWAFWGSLVGAFVVFWGNFQSMAGSYGLYKQGLGQGAARLRHAEAHLGAEKNAPSQPQDSAPDEKDLKAAPSPSPLARGEAGDHKADASRSQGSVPRGEHHKDSPLEVTPQRVGAPSRPQNGVPHGEVLRVFPSERGRATPAPFDQKAAYLADDTAALAGYSPGASFKERSWETPSKDTSVLPKRNTTGDHVEAPTERATAWPGRDNARAYGASSQALSEGNTAGEEHDPATRIILEMAERGEVGPSVVAKALGISKSTAHYKLKTLMEEGLIVRNERGYTRKV